MFVLPDFQSSVQQACSNYLFLSIFTVLGGSGLAISSTTEHQDLAWDFIQMVINPTNSADEALEYKCKL